MSRNDTSALHLNSTALAAVLLVIASVPLFFKLDALPIQMWDESRRAMNALGMLENSNYLVTHFQGKPEMWGTKPPLLIWIQTLFFHLFGVGELALRLPSALAGLVTVFMIFHFARKHLRKPQLGFFAGIILVSSAGYISLHVTRTGDFDALLTLFCTGYLLSFFLASEQEEASARRHYLWLAGLLAGLALLTKGVAGALMLPALPLYLLLRGRLRAFLRDPVTWGALLLALTPVLSYYLLREQYNPGYLQAVWDNELGGRFASTLEDHQHPFFFYLKNLIKKKFVPWIYFLPFGIWLGWRATGRTRHFTLFALLTLTFFYLVISTAQTKLMWYDAPAFPLMALIAAIGLEEIRQVLHGKGFLTPSLSLFLLIPLLGLPYFFTVKRIYQQQNLFPQTAYGEFMREIPEYRHYLLAHIDYNASILFYQKMYNRRGYEIGRNYPPLFQPGDTVVVCEEEGLKITKEQFEYQILEKGDSFCELLVISELKE